jgi:hypothetical protein
MQSVMQSVACNRMHAMDARCARWILVTHERVGRARFEMTQPFLAVAIGVRPRELSALMAEFARQGVVKFDAGSVTVLDAIGLRRRACACYAVIRKNADLAVSSPKVRHMPLATVVSMRPGTVCTLCGLTRGYPHQSHRACLAALDAELRTATARALELLQLRRKIAAESMKKYDKFLSSRPS